MQKYRVSVVSYLNSTPFIYGFQHFEPIKNHIELSLDYPAACAEKLKSGGADIGLIPVAEYPNVPQGRIISDYCIGADGPVKTVQLVSDVPMEEIEAVYLDYQSRTSVNLLKVLAFHFLKINFRYLPAKPGFETKIHNKTAGIIIGDRTFDLPRAFPFVYDLSEEWKRHTGRPFTFAVWAANRPIDSDFVRLFNQACSLGLDNIEAVCLSYRQNGFVDMQRLRDYLNRDISYAYDAAKREATEYFLELKKKIKLS